MWKNPSACHWIFLLTFAAVTVVSASEATSFIQLGCCYTVDNRIRGRIKECFTLRGRRTCKSAFIIRLSETTWQCINPNHWWIKNRIAMGNLECPSAASQYKYGD